MKFFPAGKIYHRSRLLSGLSSIFILFLGTFSIAQTNYSFQHFTSANGLQADGIDHIAQDKYGFMWFGSANGLSRFDGKNFTIYQYNANDTNSLSNNIINALCTDSSGRVWVATNDGLCYYRFEDDRFHSINIDHSNSETLDRHRVYGVVCGKDQTIWYATRTELHALYKNGAIKTFPLSFNNQQTVTTLVEDEGRHIWIGSNYNLLIQFDEQTQKIIRFTVASVPTALNTPITTAAIFPSGKDSLILGTWDAGTEVLTISDGRFQILPFLNSKEKNTSKWICPSICRASRSQLWVASFGNGVGLYDLVTGKFVLRLAHDPSNSASLCNDYVNMVFTDATGILWIATNNGVDAYDPLMHQFSWIDIPSTSASSSLRNFPNDVIENSIDPQKLWIAVAGTGLFLYDRVSGGFTLFSHHENDDRSLISNDVYCFFRDHSGTLWIGTRLGVCTVDENKNIFSPVDFENDKNQSIGSVNQIMEDRRYRMWFSTYRFGVYCYDPATKEFKGYNYDSTRSTSLPDDHVFCVLEDDQGRIWAGTQSRGVCRLDEANGKWTCFEHQRGNVHSLPDNNVYDLFEDEEKHLWIASSGGLSIMNTANDSIKTYTTSDGLCNDDIFSIQEDQRRHLWLGTYNGLSDFDPNQKKFKNYYKAEGLATNTINGACSVLSDGTIFIGAPGGLNYFNPNTLKVNQQVPSVIITSFKIFDKPVAVTRTGSAMNDIQLSYKQNELTFNFAAMNFTDADKNQFAYMLEGFDRNWIYCGNKMSATYTNLAGGKYTFRVKAANNDGIWNQTGARVALTVIPPFWKTWWFYLLITILIASLLYMIYRIRIGQILRLQRMRLRISRDLHDDIGSTLSSITMMSRMAAAGSSSENGASKEVLNVIGNASQQAMDLMSDIVWSVNPQNDKFENVIIRMREYASEILDAAKIDFKIEAGDQTQQLNVPMEKRKDFFLIFKEAVNNLAKYSNAKRVDIVLQHEHHSIQMVINDDGIGFDAEKKFSGNGLKNMKARAQSLGARFEINSNGGGTTVRLNMPLIP